MFCQSGRVVKRTQAGWLLDERASAAREKLDAAHASHYDAKENSDALRELRLLQSLGLDFHREGRTPLLLIAFEHDHIIPAQSEPAQRGEVRRRGLDHPVRGVPGSAHFPGAPGWEEVADYALTWALEHATQTVADHVTHG